MARRFVTEGLPPLAARFRERAEDFEVEEVPAYAPSGAGDHVFVAIEKRGVSTHEAVRGIARRLGRRPGDVGVAGLKDATAVARQTISLEHLRDEDRAKIDDPPRVRALSFARHGNKLKTGHLRGNRFRIVLRLEPGEAVAASLERGREALALLSREGLPNRFGAQRFGGAGGRTAALGMALLRGEPEPFVALLCGRPGDADSARVREARERFDRGDLAGARDAFPAAFAPERAAMRVLLDGGDAARAVAGLPREARDLYVSAAQSAVFNDLLDGRLETRTLSRLEAGDVAFIHAKGACFVVEDAAAEQPRADALEISPAGPLFGTRLLEAGGRPLERERAALARAGLAPASFEGRLAGAPRGARRPYRIPLAGASMASGAEAGTLELRLSLPAGAYATAVVAEILQREVG